MKTKYSGTTLKTIQQLILLAQSKLKTKTALDWKIAIKSQTKPDTTIDKRLANIQATNNWQIREIHIKITNIGKKVWDGKLSQEKINELVDGVIENMNLIDFTGNEDKYD